MLHGMAHNFQSTIIETYIPDSWPAFHIFLLWCLPLWYFLKPLNALYVTFVNIGHDTITYASFVFWVQITTNVVQIIDNVTQWPMNATIATASRSVRHIGMNTWPLHNLSPPCRIIDAFEDVVTVILQDIAFNTTLLVTGSNVALRAERVRLQWALLTQARLYWKTL